jgi:predicted ATP-grasp superfamily ATP-dependent carboligase
MICEKKRVLLTGARTLCALELSRHLYASGHEVIAADTTLCHPIQFSNTIYKLIEIPSPRFAEEEFIQSILQIVKEEKIDLLIPLWEEAIYLSKYLNRFPPSCKVFCSSFETIISLHNKWLFIRQLENLGFKIPRTCLISSKHDLQTINFKFPYVLKACYSRASRKVFKIFSSQKPDVEIEESNPWIAQEYISGAQHCSYSICEQGRILAHSVYSVDYTLDGSSCIVFQAIDHQKNFEWVSRFVKAVNYTGQISFDFIEDSNHNLYAIECNPRSTSGLHLFLPQDHIDRAFLSTTESTIFASPGIRQQIAVGMILYGWRQGIREGKFWQYIKKLFTTKDVVFSLNDPKPFLLEPLVLFSYLWNSRRRGLSLPIFFTHDLEWNHDSVDANELSTSKMQQCQCVK